MYFDDDMGRTFKLDVCKRKDRTSIYSDGWEQYIAQNNFIEAEEISFSWNGEVNRFRKMYFCNDDDDQDRDDSHDHQDDEDSQDDEGSREDEDKSNDDDSQNDEDEQDDEGSHEDEDKSNDDDRQNDENEEAYSEWDPDCYGDFTIECGLRLEALSAPFN